MRALASTIPVEIEVDSLAGLEEAMQAGADVVLLDNFTVEEMRNGVTVMREFERSTGRKVVLEASGGLTIEVAGAVAATGVDYIAVGGLTHSESAARISKVQVNSGKDVQNV